MNEIHNLQKDVSALVSILSFITRRAVDLGLGVDEERNFEPPLPTEQEHDCDLTAEPVDETDFEDRIICEDGDADWIKRSALDRLAEILAKFKTAKGAATSDDRNRDARHVTSIMMVENPSTKSATFFCAKNESLDADDLQLLQNLEHCFQSIMTHGKQQMFSSKSGKDESIERIFCLMFNHQMPRVKHYSSVLASLFREAGRALPPPMMLTSENLLQRGPRQSATRVWIDNNDLEYEISVVGTGKDSVSDNAAKCLSDRGDEDFVQEVFRDILHHFGSAHPVSESAIKRLLQRLYGIIRHPRRRPALKGALRSVLHDRKCFRKAWSSLLYLTRIFYAAVTFEQLASKSGLASIAFQQISAPVAYVAEHCAGETPKQVLRSLGNRKLPSWGAFFSRRDKVKDFIKTSRKEKPVHAEIQLLTHIAHQNQVGRGPGGAVFPYIGCSKKLCFFCMLMCSLSPIGDEPLQSRGCHFTLFPLWGLPESIPRPAVDFVRRFSQTLTALLQDLLSASNPPFQIDLLRQSSAALSTAKAVQKERPEYTTRPQVLSRMMLGFGGVLSTDQQMEVLPSHGNPGYATVLGGSSQYRAQNQIPIYEAEVTKINHVRRQDGLEEMHEMPPIQVTAPGCCRRCRSRAQYRCRTCRALYCSLDCKKRDAAVHVFTCRMPNRPNDVDFLRLTIRKTSREIESGDDERVHNALVYLFADDHLCRTFGFNNCRDVPEVLGLVCLYATLLCRVRPAVRALQEQLDSGTLGDFMANFCELEREVARINNTQPCSCVSWFWERWSTESFSVPNRDKEQYDIWVVAWNSAFESLNLVQRFKSGHEFSRPQRDVLDLYIAIQPTLWRIPDVTSAAWIKFGFCHCQYFSQRWKLAKHYLELASSGATFDEIVSAYETSSLAELMRARGIDISALASHGIAPRRPDPCEYTIFRLMVAVEHALSGRFCDCFRVHEERECHRPFETHLDRECDTNFGFHLTSSWEKWQLLHFYRHVFRQRGYDPRRMAEAAEHADRERLEAYLDALDPGMRRRLRFGQRANLLFPRLRDRMEMRTLDGSVVHAHLPCECKLHDVFGPPGISFWSREAMLGALGIVDECVQAME